MINLHEHPELPFTAGDLTLTESLRWFQDRRLTARGTWRGEAVVAKVFASNAKGRSEFDNEWKVLAELPNRGVGAPSIVHQQRPLLVLATMPGSNPSPDNAEHALLMARYTGFLHASGVMQTDQHLGNYLLDGSHGLGEITLLDAGSVVLDNVDKLNNLAILMAQFHPPVLPSSDQILEAYQGGINGDFDAALAEAREKRLRHYLKKTTRPCTEFAPIKGGFCRRELLDTFKNYDFDRAIENGTMLKDGNSATVALVDHNDSQWVIKRYNIKNFGHGVTRQFSHSRAKNSWQCGNFLKHIGIKTPLPLAYVQTSTLGIKGRAYYVTEWQGGEAALDTTDEGAWEALAQLLSTMRTLRFNHGDMKATNFLWDGRDLSVIDLDAMQLFLKDDVLIERDKKRLLANWPEDHAAHMRLCDN